MAAPVAIGLDYGAAIALGAAKGADLRMLADVLPIVEGAIIAPQADDQGGDAEDDEG